MCFVIGAASMVVVRGLGGTVAAGIALGILIITVINLLELGD
jgi:hypothetical protein